MDAAIAPAVRTAVKTELIYRNDTTVVFFFAANKNKHNAKVSLAFYNSYFTREFWAQFDEKQHFLLKCTRRTTSEDQWVSLRRGPTHSRFGAKSKALRHKMLHIYHFIIWYDFRNYRSLFVKIQCRLQWETLPDFNAFPVNSHWRTGLSACWILIDWILIGHSKFQPRKLFARRG